MIEKYKHLVGKRVKIVINNVEYVDKVLYFAGVNQMGHNVVVTQKERAMLYVEDWNKVKIEEYKNEDKWKL